MARLVFRLQVDGPPAFLDPEATRQSKICAAHVLQQGSAHPPQESGMGQGKANFDISKLAPRLKGQPDTQAVLSAPAKRGREVKETSQASAFSNTALVSQHCCVLAVMYTAVLSDTRVQHIVQSSRLCCSMPCPLWSVAQAPVRTACYSHPRYECVQTDVALHRLDWSFAQPCDV